MNGRPPLLLIEASGPPATRIDPSPTFETGVHPVLPSLRRARALVDDGNTKARTFWMVCVQRGGEGGVALPSAQPARLPAPALLTACPLCDLM